jgi:hypothetical protein
METHSGFNRLLDRAEMARFCGFGGGALDRLRAGFGDGVVSDTYDFHFQNADRVNEKG